MKKNTNQKNWLEWLVTGISGVLVAFTLGFLVYQMIYEEDTPPDIVVEQGEVVKKDGGYAVPINAYNRGTSTAENVVIEVVCGSNEELETAQITFQYLPRKSAVKGWVSFSTYEPQKKIRTRVIGYGTP